MSKFRIKTDEEQTSFYLDYSVDEIVIKACKEQQDGIIARINAVTGALKLDSWREEWFIKTGIDYKKRDSGGGYVWNVEE